MQSVKRNILQTIVLDYASFSFFTLFNRFDWHILKQADVHMTGYVWCRRHSRWHTGTIVKLSSSTILCAFQGTSSSSEHRINVTNDTKALCWSSNRKTWWFNVSLAKEKQHIFQNLQDEFHVSDFAKDSNIYEIDLERPRIASIPASCSLKNLTSSLPWIIHPIESFFIFCLGSNRQSYLCAESWIQTFWQSELLP